MDLGDRERLHGLVLDVYGLDVSHRVHGDGVAARGEGEHLTENGLAQLRRGRTMLVPHGAERVVQQPHCPALGGGVRPDPVGRHG